MSDERGGFFKHLPEPEVDDLADKLEEPATLALALIKDRGLDSFEMFLVGYFVCSEALKRGPDVPEVAAWKVASRSLVKLVLRLWKRREKTRKLLEN